MLYPEGQDSWDRNVDMDMPGSPDYYVAPTLQAVTSIFRMINTGQSIETTLNFISEQVARQLGHKFCAISLYDHDENSFEIKGSFGLSKDYLATANQRLAKYLQEDGLLSERSVTLRAFATRSIIKLESVDDAWEFDAWNTLAQKAGYDSAIFLPLVFGGQAIGAMACYDDSRTYADNLVRSLVTVAEQASTAVGLARALHAQEETIVELEVHALTSRKTNDELREVSKLTEALTSLPLHVTSFEELLEGFSTELGKEVVFHSEEPVETSQDARTEAVWGSRRYGYVSYKPGPLSEESDTQVLRQIAVLCALHISREEAKFERELRRGSDTLLALLDNEASPDQYRVLVDALNLKGGPSYRIGIVKGSVDGDLRSMRNALAEVRIPQATRGESFIFIARDTAFTPEGFSVSHASSERFSVPEGATLYASKPIQNLEEINAVYQESQGVLRLLEEHNFRLEEPVVFLENWSLLALAVRASSDDYLRQKAEAINGVLWQPANEELRKTLSCYLANSMSKSATARLLHVHVNTIKQRLTKVEHLLDLSLRDTDSLLEIKLAYYIRSHATNRDR